jgi:hypothetical protein
MQDELSIAFDISKFLSAGGSEAIFFMFVAAIGFLLFDRFRLTKKCDKISEQYFETKEKELEHIKEIIDQYHEGNVSLTRTLNEIRIVLEAIQTNISNRD